MAQIDVMKLLQDPIFQMGLGIMGAPGGFNQAVNTGMQQALTNLQAFEDQKIKRQQAEIAKQAEARAQKKFELDKQLRTAQEKRASETFDIEKEAIEYGKSRRTFEENLAALKQKQLEYQIETQPERKRKLGEEIDLLITQQARNAAEAELTMAEKRATDSGVRYAGRSGGTIAVSQPPGAEKIVQNYIETMGNFQYQNGKFFNLFGGQTAEDIAPQILARVKDLQTEAKNQKKELSFMDALEMAYKEFRNKSDEAKEEKTNKDEKRSNILQGISIQMMP